MSVNTGTPKRSANIFINYRREDSAGHSGRLFDRLGNRFPGRVFMDVDTIEPGVDFVEVIEKAVGSCEVLIVVIGREWVNLKNAAGLRRLDDPDDFVRLEVATALARNIRVIPVLVEDAPMPRTDDLPPDLAKLARRNAIELSDARWAFDVDRLIHTIEQVLQEEAPSAVRPAEPLPGLPAPGRETRKTPVWIALAAAVVLVLAGVIAWALARPQPHQESGPVASATNAGTAEAAPGTQRSRPLEPSATPPALPDPDPVAETTQAPVEEPAKPTEDPLVVRVPETGPAQVDYGRDTCKKGYVWRDARPSDHVCVTPETRAQTAGDNRQAATRREPAGGPYGPDTCLQGYVWRDAFEGDHVCVTPEAREQARLDNGKAGERHMSTVMRLTRKSLLKVRPPGR